MNVEAVNKNAVTAGASSDSFTIDEAWFVMRLGAERRTDESNG